MEYDIADQRVFLASISHREFAPRCVDGVGSVRLYGAFESVDEASTHAPRVLAEDPGVSILTLAAREWSVVAASAERFTNTDLMAERRAATLSRYATETARDAREFGERYAKRNQPRDDEVACAAENSDDDHTGGDVAPSEAAAAAATVSLPPNVTYARPRLSAAALPAGQRVAVVSSICLRDDPEGEFLIRPYACFDTIQEADAWVRNVVAPRVQDVHIDIVTVGAWIRPQMMRSDCAPKEVFRDKELDKIVQHRKSEPARVQAYKDWRAENGLEVD